MKTIPFVPACQNMEEIQKLAVLITDFIHPEMIVLFGRYAGMPSYDIRGGYELLILTANQLAVGVKEVMGYLAMNFPEKDRKETSFVDRCFRSPPFFPKPFFVYYSQGGSFTV